MIRPIKPQLAFDPSAAHAVLDSESRTEYLARLLSGVPRDGTWVMEPKLDGWRWQVIVDADGVRSYSGRNGKQQPTPAAVERELSKLPAGTILDGELIARGGTSTDVARLDRAHERQFVVFDVLAFNGIDATTYAWRQRRDLLEGMFDGYALREAVVAVPVGGVDVDLLCAWIDSGVEGAVCKRADAPYRPGARRRDVWVKIKPKQTTDAYVYGWEHGSGCAVLAIRLVETGAMTTVKYDGADPDALLGRRVEVQHFGTMPSGKVRHPGFVRTREDLEPAA